MPGSVIHLSACSSVPPSHKKYIERLESGVPRVQGFPESGPRDSVRHQLLLRCSIPSSWGNGTPVLLWGPRAPAHVFHSSKLHLPPWG